MGEYDYGNARLRAMKSRLFDRRAYGEMAAFTRLEALVARLAESPYATEINDALARHSGVRVIAEAARLHLAGTLQKIRGFFAQNGARLISILLARWDLQNLKTIFRGQEAGAQPEDIIQELVAAGDLDESALRALARQLNLRATADLLRTWNVEYAGITRAALVQLAGTNNWNVFENAVDSRFYERLLLKLTPGRADDEMVREFLEREIDTVNIMTAVRLREAGLGIDLEEVQQQFLNGGSLSCDWMVALATSGGREEALAMLRESKFRAAALPKQKELEVLSLQRALDRDLMSFAHSYFSRDPLTIATAIGFVAAQTVEAQNLRLIAHGVAAGMGRPEIEKDLTLH
jgi:V/A-type H+-transporting ATPase subunit C